MFHSPKRAEMPADLLKKLPPEGADVVAAYGGDGSVMEVAQGAYGD